MELTESQLVKAIASGSVEHIEVLVDKYEDKVIQMVVDLTGIEESAPKVAEQVFVEVCQSILSNTDEELETLIHRHTYELAIASLLGSIESHYEETKQTFIEVIGHPAQTAIYESNGDDLQKARWQLAETNSMLAEIAEESLGTNVH